MLHLWLLARARIGRRGNSGCLRLLRLRLRLRLLWLWLWLLWLWLRIGGGGILLWHLPRIGRRRAALLLLRRLLHIRGLPGLWLLQLRLLHIGRQGHVFMANLPFIAPQCVIQNV